MLGLLLDGVLVGVCIYLLREVELLLVLGLLFNRLFRFTAVICRRFVLCPFAHASRSRLDVALLTVPIRLFRVFRPTVTGILISCVVVAPRQSVFVCHCPVHPQNAALLPSSVVPY